MSRETSQTDGYTTSGPLTAPPRHIRYEPHGPARVGTFDVERAIKRILASSRHNAACTRTPGSAGMSEAKRILDGNTPVSEQTFTSHKTLTAVTMGSGTETTGPTWQDLVAVKQQESRDAILQAWRLPSEIIDGYQKPFAAHQHRLIEADIPRRSGILTEREIEITEKFTVRELLENLATGALSALEVTTAFCKRAAIAQQLTSCLTEMFFEDAIQRAKQLDDVRLQGKPVGPLHGLPISVKDSFKLTGKDATVGYAAFIGDKAVNNSALVDVLLELGAVLYVKTNIPQTMMTADSENNIFGRTLNPWNTSLTAGGSSGGEGALVAFRGSPLGVGTDIAGSVRIPALCCGTYGFKPTTARIPYGKQAYGVKPGMKFITACAGPLANDMDALEIFTKAVIDAEPARHDSEVLDVPWRTTTKVTGKSKLRIGLLPEDSAFPLHPPIRTAIREAVSKLEADGHEIIPLDASKCRMSDAIEVAWNMFGLDTTGMSHITKIGEPVVRSITQVFEAYRGVEQRFTKGMEELERLDRLAALIVKRLSVAEDWREIWTTYGMDAVLSPSAQNTAVPHDTFGLPPYTALLNVLDYPACVIPFQKVRPELDPEPVKMQSGQHGPNYDPAAVAGAPCSIQVFTSKMRDEECLAVAKIIDKCIQGVR